MPCLGPVSSSSGGGTGPNSSPGLAKPGVNILTAECCGSPGRGCLLPCSHPIAVWGISTLCPEGGGAFIRAGDGKGHGATVSVFNSAWSTVWDGVSLGMPSQGGEGPGEGATRHHTEPALQALPSLLECAQHLQEPCPPPPSPCKGLPPSPSTSLPSTAKAGCSWKA